jgi:hypothetical protein
VGTNLNAGSLRVHAADYRTDNSWRKLLFRPIARAP